MRRAYTLNGLRVAQARQALRDDEGRPMSQAEFARRVGLHVTTMNRIENDKANVSRETLEVIATKTGCSIEWLQGLDDAQAKREALARQRIATALEPLSDALADVLLELAAEIGAADAAPVTGADGVAVV